MAKPAAVAFLAILTVLTVLMVIWIFPAIGGGHHSACVQYPLTSGCR